MGSDSESAVQGNGQTLGFLEDQLKEKIGKWLILMGIFKLIIRILIGGKSS